MSATRAERSVHMQHHSDSEPPASGSPGRRRVLLVDDDPDLLAMLRTVLPVRGAIDVVGAADCGEAALALASELEPDIVVLDLGLPDLAGRDVLTRLREVAPRSAVIVFTGDEAVRSDVTVWGAERFVSKADELGRLIEALESVDVPEPADVSSLTPWVALPPDTASPSMARAFAASVLAERGCAHVADDARLVVTELVTNVVLHAGTECRLSLEIGDRSIRVEVTDTGPGTPDPRSPALLEVGGRGLQIVSKLSSSWGVAPGGDGAGKTVWAELPI